MDAKHYTAEDLICNESFQRYCMGQNEADAAYWDSWIKANPSQITEVTEAIRVISILNGNQGNVHQQLEHLKDSIKRFDHLKSALTEKTPQPVPVRSRTSIRKYAVGIAASLLILLTAGYFILMQNGAPENQATALSNTLISSGNEPRKTVVLPDGSVVTLRNNSSLTLSATFNKGNRELDLSGEAFFDVSHNAAMPFIVHTEEAKIEVLGTVFNVSAYPGSEHTETSLFRGKVAVSPKNHPGQKVILTPNKKLIVVKSYPGTNSQPASALQAVPLTPDPVNHKAKEIAWVRNRLKIEDEPLIAIAQKLKDWYGIDIVFNDEEVKQYRYSGTFESETVLKALEALQLSYPFNFTVEKEKIVISR